MVGKLHSHVFKERVVGCKLDAKFEHVLTEQRNPCRSVGLLEVAPGGQGRSLPCNRADGGCVASWGQHHLTGNGADFPLVLNSRTLEEPIDEAKQMTTGQPVGAASPTTGGFSTAVRIGSKSVSSRSDSF